MANNAKIGGILSIVTVISKPDLASGSTSGVIVA
jgi:hypothetical protein